MYTQVFIGIVYRTSLIADVQYQVQSQTECSLTTLYYCVYQRELLVRVMKTQRYHYIADFAHHIPFI